MGTTATLTSTLTLMLLEILMEEFLVDTLMLMPPESSSRFSTLLTEQDSVLLILVSPLLPPNPEPLVAPTFNPEPLVAPTFNPEPLVAPVYTGVAPEPVVDTPEVAEAKAAHLALVAAAAAPAERKRREADAAILGGASRIISAPTPFIHNAPVRPYVAHPYAGLGYHGLGYAGLGYAGLGYHGLGYAGLHL